MNDKVPKCGESDKRNIEYKQNFSSFKFYKSLVNSNEPIIFDIGAHKGETIKFFKSIFKYSKIYSFEPDPENFITLNKISKKYNTKAENLAITNKEGYVDFYKQSISHLGGLFPINEKSNDSLGYAQKASNKKIRVKANTLDNIIQNFQIKIIDILKIDVQGFEVGVLEGAKNTIEMSKIIQIEVSLYDFYCNTKNSWFEVNQILGSNNFELFDIAKVSKNPKNYRTDWIELIFKKINLP